MPETPSLYRRHRPRSFDDVVGQEHVVRTLRNAVERDKVHHANLFVGSRGTGKTSMAKILAACLNCVNGPTTTPCGVCESCVTIANATSLDVIEMDAASNNSVDDIRDLRERVSLAPVVGRHKVYILDEAHMLSSQAWNAFLKTLEEPPPHTIFVLATTEAQKVLPTVVDRCHRFDFSRPSVEQVAAVLRRVAEQESIELPDAAAGLIARAATGSFRDALGTLEQLVTYSGSTIALEDVLAVLGVVDADLLFGALDAVAAHDPREALLAVARLNDSGRDAGQFLRDLESHARELLVIQTLNEVPAELRMTADRDERALAQSARIPAADVTRVLDLLAAAQEAIKNGADARVQLELALIKAAQPAADASTRALLNRIERLEAALGEAPPAAAPPAPPAEPSASAEPAAHEAAASAPTASASPNPPAPPTASAPPAASASSLPAPEPADAPATTAVAEPAPSAPPGALDDLVALWPAVLEQLREAHGPLKATTFADARPLAVEGDELRIAFPQTAEFSMRKARDRAYCEALADAVRTVTGARVVLRCELADELPAEAAPEPETLSEEELVARFVAEFDAQEIPPDEDKT